MSRGYVGVITIPENVAQKEATQTLSLLFQSCSRFLEEQEAPPKKFGVKDGDTRIKVVFTFNE